MQRGSAVTIDSSAMEDRSNEVWLPGVWKSQHQRQPKPPQDLMLRNRFKAIEGASEKVRKPPSPSVHQRRAKHWAVVQHRQALALREATAFLHLQFRQPRLQQSTTITETESERQQGQQGLEGVYSLEEEASGPRIKAAAVKKENDEGNKKNQRPKETANPPTSGGLASHTMRRYKQSRRTQNVGQPHFIPPCVPSRFNTSAVSARATLKGVTHGNNNKKGIVVMEEGGTPCGPEREEGPSPLLTMNSAAFVPRKPKKVWPLANTTTSRAQLVDQGVVEAGEQQSVNIEMTNNNDEQGVNGEEEETMQRQLDGTTPSTEMKNNNNDVLSCLPALPPSSSYQEQRKRRLNSRGLGETPTSSSPQLSGRGVSGTSEIVTQIINTSGRWFSRVDPSTFFKATSGASTTAAATLSVTTARGSAGDATIATRFGPPATTHLPKLQWTTVRLTRHN